MSNRQGLNTTLSYTRGTALRQYKVRCNAVSHGVQMVSDESQSRMRRAYYPHRVSSMQFSLSIVLVGYDERKSFTNWMSDYATYTLDPDTPTGSFPSMGVFLPDYSFYERGVPLSGYEWGDHVGSMVFNPTVTFETTYEQWNTGQPPASKVEDTWSAFSQDKAIQYFYPFGQQLAGDQAPANYDKVQYPGDPSQFNNNYYGGGQDPAGQPLPPSNFN
jgi:hypothetical protein